MTFINYASREINCKIVYYGPGLCGKTTNLQYIYNKTNPEAKGKMISLATETERTLFFDFLPLSLGEIRGDLHVHTTASDGTLPVAAMAEEGFQPRAVISDYDSWTYLYGRSRRISAGRRATPRSTDPRAWPWHRTGTFTWPIPRTMPSA